MSSEAVESFLNDLVLDASKAVLRHPDLDLFHDDDAELCLFLYVHFQRLANQQHREDSIAIADDSVRVLLQNVLLKNLAGTKGLLSVSAPKELTLPGREDDLAVWWRSTDGAPMILQRTLREQLTQLRLNIAAFGEVVELCRFLDEQRRAESERFAHLGLKHTPAPFGTVNLIHFVAIYMTLAPTRSLFDLIAKLFVEVQPMQPLLNDGVKIKILHSWALIDSTNCDALEAMCDTMIAHPNLTLPLLLELHPSVRDINTERYVAPLTASSQQQSRVVVHSEDDAPVDLLAALGTMPAVGGGAAVAMHSEDDGGDGYNATDEEYEVPRSADDQAFWSQLVA